MRLFSLLLILLSFSSVSGNAQPRGRPFNGLQAQIDALADAVEQLQHSSELSAPVLYDANGTPIGLFYHQGPIVWAANVLDRPVWLVTEASVGLRGLGSAFFTSTDCSGQPYLGITVSPPELQRPDYRAYVYIARETGEVTRSRTSRLSCGSRHTPSIR